MNELVLSIVLTAALVFVLWFLHFVERNEGGSQEDCERYSTIVKHAHRQRIHVSDLGEYPEEIFDVIKVQIEECSGVPEELIQPDEARTITATLQLMREGLV